MHILHIDTGREMRGGQYQVLLLNHALERNGCEQTLLTGPAIRSRRACKAASGRAIRSEVRHCDLIHAHDAKAHTLALLHGGGKPVVVARRVAFPLRRTLLSRWKYRGAAHFIAISEYVSSILQACGVPSARISVVHDATPLERTAPAPERTDQTGLSSQDRGLRIVTPDFNDPLKGRDLAVQACRAAGVQLRISQDLSNDLRSADALLYLSRSEGLGSAILLAMANGVPAVASRIGGIPEAVDDGRTGFLVENDVESIVSALGRLRDDRALRERMSKAALTMARHRFSPETMAERTIRVYRKVICGTEETLAEGSS